jgi:hypothetical protein
MEAQTKKGQKVVQSRTTAQVPSLALKVDDCQGYHALVLVEIKSGKQRTIRLGRYVKLSDALADGRYLAQLVLGVVLREPRRAP